jgi:hypothetical protein
MAGATIARRWKLPYKAEHLDVLDLTVDEA